MRLLLLPIALALAAVSLPVIMAGFLLEIAGYRREAAWLFDHAPLSAWLDWIDH